MSINKINLNINGDTIPSGSGTGSVSNSINKSIKDIYKWVPTHVHNQNLFLNSLETDFSSTQPDIYISKPNVTFYHYRTSGDIINNHDTFQAGSIVFRRKEIRDVNHSDIVYPNVNLAQIDVDNTFGDRSNDNSKYITNKLEIHVRRPCLQLLLKNGATSYVLGGTTNQNHGRDYNVTLRDGRTRLGNDKVYTNHVVASFVQELDTYDPALINSDNTTAHNNANAARIYHTYLNMHNHDIIEVGQLRVKRLFIEENISFSSNSSTNTIGTLGFPDYTNGSDITTSIPSSGSGYTVTSDGWILVQLDSNSTLKVNGGDAAWQSSGGIHSCQLVPVKKGDKITVPGGGVHKSIFYPMR